MDFLNVFLAFVVAIGITCFAFWTTALLFAIYETLCDRYYDNTQTEVQPYATYTLDEPYTFEALNYTVNDDGSVSWVGSRSGVYLDSNYEATVQYFKGLCQGAFDAFHYDFSEVFWAGTGQFSCSPSRFEYDSESGICTAYVTTVKMNMKDRYSGARNDVEGFNNAVANAVDRLRGDVNAAPTEALKIKVIHDYVVDHAEYYYPSGSNERESSASGFFNYDGQVQCEGYSRAFIVLLHQFGIEGVLGSGTMPNGNHAWAYVKLNGEWYLVDTTFDDCTWHWRTYRYYLVGQHYGSDSVPKCKSHCCLLQSGSEFKNQRSACNQYQETKGKQTTSYFVMHISQRYYRIP